MEEVAVGIEVLTVLTHLRNGKIEDAITGFADEFRFKDHGIGLEFKDKNRLAEFFHKAQELYPGSLLLTDRVLVSGDHVITEWTLRATHVEPFSPGVSLKIPVTLRGTSIVRSDNGKITDWADYYDGLTSRRTALASHFTDWAAL